MPRKQKKNPEKFAFTTCDECDGYPAIWRWWCGKSLCSECAKRSFVKYLATLVSGVGAVWYLFF